MQKALTFANICTFSAQDALKDSMAPFARPPRWRGSSSDRQGAPLQSDCLERDSSMTHLTWNGFQFSRLFRLKLVQERTAPPLEIIRATSEREPICARGREICGARAARSLGRVDRPII